MSRGDRLLQAAAWIVVVNLAHQHIQISSQLCHDRVQARYAFDELEFWREVRRVWPHPKPSLLFAPAPHCLLEASQVARLAHELAQGCLTVQHEALPAFKLSYGKAVRACASNQAVVEELSHQLGNIRFDQLPSEYPRSSSWSACGPIWLDAAKKFAGAAFRAGLLLLGVEIFSQGRHPNSKSSDVLLQLLGRLENDSPGLPLRGAEIGVARGKTSARLLEGSPLLELTLVDPYLGGVDYDCKNKEARDTADDVKKEMMERIRPFAQRAGVFIQTSVSAASVLADGAFDLVFIDGNHSYDAVFRDIVAWLPKVRRGGFIAGHDWNHWHLGVTKAVAKALPFSDLLWGADDVWIYRVPEGSR